MALDSPYLAAEKPAERRSRALHRFIVGSPILLLLAVGLVGHLRHRPYAGTAATPDFDRRVLAYRDRVVRAEALPQSDDPSLRLYAQEAGRWIEGFDAGSLTPLPPAAYEDHLRDGVRGEVFRAGIGVASYLALASERRLDAGHPREAASAALLAARLANALRGFELQACLQSMLTQRRSIEILAQAWPSLSVAERRAMRPSLTALRIDPGEVDGLFDRENAQFQEYLRRQPPSPESIRAGSLQLGGQAVAAIRRSVRLSNAWVAALLDGRPPSTRRDATDAGASRGRRLHPSFGSLREG